MFDEGSGGGVWQERRRRLEELRTRAVVLEDTVPGDDEGESLLGSLCALRDQAAAWPEAVAWADLPGPVLLEAVRRLDQIHRSLAAARCAAWEAVDRTGASQEDCGLGAPSWFSHHLGGDPGDARRGVRAGRVLRRFSKFTSALARGGVSVEHVMALANAVNPRNIEHLAGVEEQLVTAATNMSVRAFADEVRRLARLADTDGPEPRPENNSASITRGPDGELHIRVLFEGATAEKLAHQPCVETDAQRRAAWQMRNTTGEDMPTPAQLRAAAIAALLQRGAGVGYDNTRRPRTEAVIVIQADDTTCEDLRSLDGRPIPPEVARQLVGDAWLQALIVDSIGQPLWLGRTRRYATSALRRAITIRDGGCIFPGCDMPPDWCDIHHEPPWSEGGTTDPCSNAMTCGTHHPLAHSKRWDLQPVPHGTGPPPPVEDQRFQWHDHHSGRTIPANQRGLSPIGPSR